MIAAHEALALVRQSEEHLKTLVEGLDSPIRQAAERGKRSIDVPMEYVGMGVTSLSHPFWRPLEKALTNIGYRVMSVPREGGGGLGSMDDERTQFEVVLISW
jgi:hypothetical protein